MTENFPFVDQPSNDGHQSLDLNPVAQTGESNSIIDDSEIDEHDQNDWDDDFFDTGVGVFLYFPINIFDTIGGLQI